MTMKPNIHYIVTRAERPLEVADEIDALADGAP